MSRGVDPKKGIIDLHMLLPQPGDSVTIMNCGDHYELREQHVDWSIMPEVSLTEEDIERLKAGTINWH